MLSYFFEQDHHFLARALMKWILKFFNFVWIRSKYVLFGFYKNQQLIRIWIITKLTHCLILFIIYGEGIIFYKHHLDSQLIENGCIEVTSTKIYISNKTTIHYIVKSSRVQFLIQLIGL